MTRFLSGLCLAAWMGVGLAAPIDPSRLALYDLEQVQGHLLAVGERGAVLRSLDQGLSWQSTPVVTDRALTALAFASDGQHGVAVGHGGTVLRSSDGGSNWLKVSVPSAGKDALLGVSALRDGRFIAYGAFGLYVESSDQGQTWTRRQVVAPDFERHISKVIEVGPQQLLLVGESATLALSADGGVSWKRLASPYEGSLFGAMSLPGGVWLIYGMRGNVFRSSSAGAQWSKVDFPASVAINGGSVQADGQVVLVGNNGVMAFSSDRGQHFVADRVPQRSSLAQARRVADGSWVYVGYLAAGRKSSASAPAHPQ